MVFPRRSKKPKQGDSSAEELQTVQQHKGRHVLPIVHEKPEPEMVNIPADLKVDLLAPSFVLRPLRDMCIALIALHCSSSAHKYKSDALVVILSHQVQHSAMHWLGWLRMCST